MTNIKCSANIHLLFIVFILFLSSCLHADYYNKNVQEIPIVWKKLIANKARIYLHPGGHLPGFFDRKMGWHHLKKKLSLSQLKKKKAFIVFEGKGPKVKYIDLKHVKRIFAKNKNWDTYDLAKMLKLSGGEITFNKKYEPMIQIGSIKVKYPLIRWKVEKLNKILKKLFHRIDFRRQNPKFFNYLKKIATKSFSYPHEDMDEEKFFFILHSINQAYRVFQRKPNKKKFQAHISKTSTEQNPQYAFSLIPFKKGDLDKHASYILKNGIEKNFKQVALFFPLYYSGGSSSKRKVKRSFGKILHGRHYFYEDAFAIDENELKRCLDKIWHSGLSLTFIPHLESIQTLNRVWESSWRIYSEIPLDKRYFNRAYRTLFHSIRKNKDIMRPNQTIRITVASEVDPAFLTETNISYELIKTIKREIRLSGLSRKQFKLVWNPNGDFLHGWHKKQNKPNYDKLVKIFNNIDSIAPSTYEKHGHIIDGSYTSTRKKFRYRVHKIIRRMFPRHNVNKLIKRLDKIIDNDFSLGEFGLNDNNSEGNYIDFHREFKKNNPSGNMILWSSGKWDHANVTKINPGKHEKDIDKALNGF